MTTPDRPGPAGTTADGTGTTAAVDDRDGRGRDPHGPGDDGHGSGDDTTPTNGHVITTTGLTRHYGDVERGDFITAVDHLDLAIDAGEVFGLLGPNGAGKTTTILMLLGLTEPSAGDVSVLGMDPRRQPRRVKRRVGYLPDAVGFYDDLTARQNLRYTADLNGLPPAESDERLDVLLRRVGLSEVGDHLVETFSRGMRQRLGVADALVKDPRILIMDEPTIAIDPRGVEEVLDLIRWLRDDQGVTVLLSSHLLHQVEEVCDRVGLFVEGRLVAQGRVDELAAELDVDDPDHPLDAIYRRYFTAADSTGTASRRARGADVPASHTEPDAAARDDLAPDAAAGDDLAPDAGASTAATVRPGATAAPDAQGNDTAPDPGHEQEA